jgi:hypothetical protein
MNIQRIRRTSKYEQADKCGFCDKDMETGYRFYFDDGRGSVCCCDSCLAKTRKSKIGFLCESPTGDAVE